MGRPHTGQASGGRALRELRFEGVFFIFHLLVQGNDYAIFPEEELDV
jgi:hypothetical protein